MCSRSSGRTTVSDSANAADAELRRPGARHPIGRLDRVRRLGLYVATTRLFVLGSDDDLV